MKVNQAAGQRPELSLKTQGSSGDGRSKKCPAMSAPESMPPPSPGLPPTQSMPVEAAPARRASGTGGGSSPAGFRLTLAGLALAVVGVAAAILLIGPGGKDSSAPFSPIASAAQRTASSPGVQVEIAAKVNAPQTGESMTMTGNGVFNGQTNQGKLDFRATSSSGPSIQMSEVFSGSVFYLSSPQLTPLMPPGTSWMKVDLGDVLSDAESQAGGFDPTQQLEELQGISSDIHAVGSETVDDVITTHYTGTLDVEAAAERLRDQGEDEIADQLENSGVSSPVDVWIDRKGMVRRMDMTVAFPAAGTSASMAMSMTFSHFGIKPRITLPAESEVFDASSLTEDALG